MGGEGELSDQDRGSNAGETETESDEESSTWIYQLELTYGKQVRLTNEHADVLSSSLDGGSDKHH